MHVEEVHAELKDIEEIVKSKGVNPDVTLWMNWMGHELRIEVGASEPYDPKGYWNRSKSFQGSPNEVEGLISAARQWAYSIPSEEDRTIEFMLEKLNKLADELPKGQGEIASRAWEEIYKMLKAKAERIARNGLPSPERVREVS